MRRPWITFLALIFAVSLAGPSRAGDTPPEAFGEVTFETPEGGAYAQEMITMVVRFYFKVRATTEQLEQPNLDALGWTQLGRDSWAPTKIGSVNWFGFERRIAIFAPEAKTYTIPPFTHHVTLIDAQDVRWKVDAVSKPATITIRPWTAKTDGPNDEKRWWLPARSVTVADAWSIDPATLKAGEVTRRRLEVSAVGVTAEQLPPAIETQSPGLVVFPGPVERRTEIVESVPVGHAVYTYDIRPHTGDPTILHEVLLPWFDTGVREMRQAIVPGANVGEGMVIPGQPMNDDAVTDRGPSKRLFGLGAGILAFLVGVAVLLMPGRSDREPVPVRLQREGRRFARTMAVRLAAWQDRPEALRSAIYTLARSEGTAGQSWLGDAEVTASLAALDRALFGKAGATPAVPLRPIAASVLRTRARLLRAADIAAETATAPLSPFGR